MTRIIAGSERGRRLQVPDGTLTRPTSDRAREGLFSSLQSLTEVEGAAVLDLYAGSGALGLEALSRGALSATLVEAHPAAVEVLHANVEAVGLPGAHVVHAPVELYLAHGAEPRYDVVLLDPPYELDVAPVLAALVPWLAPDAVVAVERRRRGPDVVWPGGLEGVRERKYGEAMLWYAVLTGTPDSAVGA
ncbi:MAG: methyltransferase [Frankiales bacterium]|nr:methyltransferase [Frankiales bacterium]